MREGSCFSVLNRRKFWRIDQFFNYFFIFLVKFYQKNISCMFPSCCRFYPSCSNYAIRAFEKYNIFKSLCLIFLRILRCNCFSRGGFDEIN
ncbi:MAG: membrane protein insertion efficiency factor YidD [Candidatus Improbicoccus devescovinae]|nr:MAG: membrane protein insertion efficiency factor YidD [Candidatus Improbicoccus devescovinae]